MRSPLRHLPHVLPLLLLTLVGCASLRSTSFHEPALRRIDRTIEQAIGRREVPGGVFWLEHAGRSEHRAYGSRALAPRPERMTERTIFDAASLTKVTATAPAVFILIQRGRLSLDAPVATYLPEFRGGWRDEVTLRHLLTHTSGLRPDVDLEPFWSGHASGIARALAEEPRNRPGLTFRYSDINFILLGEIVERVSGEPLDRFAEREIFAPLGMRDTHFLPFSPGSDNGQAAARVITSASQNATAASHHRIAPTSWSDGVMLRGVVHDPTARRMGGVAGHAGLFTTARDLATFARMFAEPARLASCESAERSRAERPCAPLTIATMQRMTSVLSPPAVTVRRGGGWDIDSGFSRPRGDHFPIGSFGHTGFTGGMLWIDPFSHTFWLFLSNRVHPEGHGAISALQRRLGTLAAEAVRDFDFAHVSGALPPRVGGVVEWTDGADVANGIDVLYTTQYRALRGLRIGLITNHTGIDRAGNPTIDLLRSAPGVTLVALFSPEHGIRGEVDAPVGDGVDRRSGLPLYSLYGERRKPSAAQLAGVDALVFDVQDVGTRFYTYISTMGLAMEAAAENGKKFIVLDRVNPIGGVAVEGPSSEGASSFTAFHPIAIRHGMTVGELAQMIRAERHLALELEVVPLKNWSRAQWQDEAGLPWINTSPNMRSLAAAALYPGIGILESALAVGRGTPTPFEIVGAPCIDGVRLAAALEQLALPGLRFEPIRFTPTASTFHDRPCNGVRLRILDRRALQPVRTALAIATLLQRVHPGEFAVDALAPLLRDAATLDAIRAGRFVTDTSNAAFVARRAPYLLYP